MWQIETVAIHHKSCAPSNERTNARYIVDVTPYAGGKQNISSLAFDNAGRRILVRPALFAASLLGFLSRFQLSPVKGRSPGGGHLLGSLPWIISRYPI